MNLFYSQYLKYYKYNIKLHIQQYRIWLLPRLKYPFLLTMSLNLPLRGIPLQDISFNYLKRNILNQQSNHNSILIECLFLLLCV